MADFKPPSASAGNIGPPIGPPMKPQFQMPHPGQPSPQMPGIPPSQRVAVPGGPGISPAPLQNAQLPPYRPGITPPVRPAGMSPRPGMSPAPPPGPLLPPVSSSLQPPTSSAVPQLNGVNQRLAGITLPPSLSPGMQPPSQASTPQSLHPGMGPPMRPPVASPSNGVSSAFGPPTPTQTGAQQGMQRPPGPSADGSSNLSGPMRPPPMGQNAGTPTHGSTTNLTGPPSKGPSPQFGAPPGSGPSSQPTGPGPQFSASPLNGPGFQYSGPPVNGPSPRMAGPPTSGPGQQFGAPPMNGPSQRMSGPPSNGPGQQFGVPPLNGPSPRLSGPPLSSPGQQFNVPPGPGSQFGNQSFNGPTSQYAGPPPLSGPSSQFGGSQTNLGIRPGMSSAPPMQSYSQPNMPQPLLSPYSQPGMAPPLQAPPTMAQQQQQQQQQQHNVTRPQYPPLPQQQHNVMQQNTMPPPPPMSNVNGLNGPSHLPPPPMSGSQTAPPSNASRGIGTQPSRPAGMPPPIQQQPQQHNAAPVNGLSSRLGNLSFHQGMEPVDLLQNRHILPTKAIPAPKPRLQADMWNNANCSPDIFRCTLTKIPETDALLKKARLPLGVLIHPFKDLSHLPVIQCSTIVRCRQCRTYINPFVTFVDQRRWRCNICYRVNELPEEFLYDPVSKSYGDPSRRPECKSSTIEFIAPSEYMLRPPQPAVYVFCLDTSRQAIETGYLKVFCDVLLDELDKLPGDSRTQVAFITYDRSIHFYAMPEGASQPTQLTVSDVDDIFLPSPSDLLVNMQENRNLIIQLLEDLPNLFAESHATDSALGAALQAAFKLASPTGGRITVFQHILPKLGPGALPNRESPAESKNSSDSSLLGPATDFYKKMSLDCSGQQIAVDLFAMGTQYQDLATLSGMSKFSAGQIQQFPGYHVQHNPAIAAKFENALRRYLTRKIGFEAVMRVRCTRGLTLHTFHGNFFVRSTDLLSLPNINPDAGFGIQVAIEEDLKDSREVSFQAALLYTSSKGERRIRVHTLCLPTTASINDVINGADEMAIVGMLTKFGADRAVSDSLADAKEGLVVSCVDTVETYRTQASMSIPNGLLISQSLKLLPLHVLACLRSTGFRPGTKLDDRSFSFAQLKSLPLQLLMQSVYPDLYRVDMLTEEGALHEEGGDSSDEDGNTEIIVPQPERLQLSFERISATGMYLMDLGDIFYLYLSRGLHAFVLEKCFGVTRLHDVNEGMTELPELDNSESEKLRTFVQWLNGQKPFPAPIKIIREDGKSRHLFVEKMIEDRMDNSFSYFEFLQHIKQQIK